MKKIIAFMCMGAMVLSLVACSGKASQQPDKDGTKTGDEDTGKEPEQKELTDPRGKTLESTATGEPKPQLVETVYETKDVVIADYIPTEMGYAVDPTGATDSTAGLQKVLYDCYEAGGGTVYLPAGNYAISDTVYIPPYVTLRGDWQDPDVGTEYGTIVSVWMETEDSECAGAFEMGGSSGAIGLTVYYPLQSLDCVMPYPYAFYVEGEGADFMLFTVRDVTIINGYRGIGTSSKSVHESLHVENVKGTFLKCGFGAANSSDVGTVKGFTVNNKYWKEAAADCMDPVSDTLIDLYTKKYTTGLRLGDLEWTEFDDLSVDGCAVGIHIVKGERIEFAGSLYDVSITNCEQGVLVDSIDTRWGALIARSHIEGGIINNTEGRLKLCDVEVSGDITELVEGTVIVDETDLDPYAIDPTDFYVKPAENLIIATISNGLFVDAAPELQRFLDEAAESGGVVYVPAGTYRFRSPLTVPEGVELRGASSVANREQNGISKGTVFLCYYGDDASNQKEDQAFITLAGRNAGLNGIRIIYPENSPKSDDINSTYTVRGTAAGVYVVNTSIVASAYGVDFYDCDDHYIEGLITCCYYNVCRLGGTGGVMNKCLQNGTVLSRTGTAGLVNWVRSDTIAALTDPILREECEYIIVEDATEQLIYSAFAYGCKTSVTNVNSKNTRLINIGSDNIGSLTPQLYMNGGSLTGVNIMRYNGYSYELEKGDIALYNRIAINEVGEGTIEKSK